jgi:hypothetical protein
MTFVLGGSSRTNVSRGRQAAVGANGTEYTQAYCVGTADHNGDQDGRKDIDELYLGHYSVAAQEEEVRPLGLDVNGEYVPVHIEVQ